MMWFANAVAWIATSVAVIGMYLTKSAWCLWTLFIPALMMADYAKINMRKEEVESENKDEMAD